jgi:hypothetical protein
MSKVDDEMMKTIASYTGPVTVCPPGEPRGKRTLDATGKWFLRHRHDVRVVDEKVERKRQNRERQRQNAIRKRNGPLLRNVERQERKALRTKERVRELRVVEERPPVKRSKPMRTVMQSGRGWAVVDLRTGNMMRTFPTSTKAWAWLQRQ